MPPRPLHRWKSFWLGVIVVVFLAWAWVRSMKRFDYLAYGFRNHELASGVLQTTGQVGFWISDGKDWVSGLRVKSMPLSSIVYSSHGRTGRNHVHLRISHLQLILLFLLPWTTFLVWRARRMKRHAPGIAGLQTGLKGS